MSEYNEIYKNEKFVPKSINDLDKSWTDIWVNTKMVNTSNILDIMLNRDGFTVDQVKADTAGIMSNTSNIITKLGDIKTDTGNIKKDTGDIKTGIVSAVDKLDQATKAVLKQDIKTVQHFQNQNNALDQTIQNMNDLYSTDDQKVVYQSAQIEYLNTINTIFYFIYFALLIVVAFILIFKIQTISLFMRVIIAILFILYPFIIGFIEHYLYMAGKYISALLTGTVYTV